MKVVGIISGTSFDAIETAAADLRLEGDAVVLRPLGSRSVPYDSGLRTAVAEVLPPAATNVREVCTLDTRLGQAFAEAAAEAAEQFCGGQADLIVSHGQTVFHWVEGNRALGTLQLGQPAWISARTGSPVVSDLRSRDIAAGGHGAPLVSLLDVLLLGESQKVRAALNLGGISNVTVVSEGRPPLAYDTGPANALIDATVQHFSGGSEQFDSDGLRGGRGTVEESLLERLLADPYYDTPPPKSTGKEYFHLPYLLDELDQFGHLDEDDIIATLTALTARTVARELERWQVEEVVASGGGTANPTLMGMISESAPQAELRTTEAWGIPSSSKEAYAFALMGFLTMHGLPANVPSCTGADSPVVLGSITPGSSPLVMPDPATASPTSLRIEASVPGI
ncbi:MAG: anhydro-N-acetylmuramic acid kinase [Actinomycetota bacterium]|nr:anhydro-N-acetylmuramic acid kinase [Actinomycetota bacterium]MDQ3438209.1 anhydro-N-acetylmuramic acid kinase [Actinomycetota bacterium]